MKQLAIGLTLFVIAIGLLIWRHAPIWGILVLIILLLLFTTAIVALETYKRAVRKSLKGTPTTEQSKKK